MEHGLCHFLHLLFLGTSIADYGAFHLQRRIFIDWNISYYGRKQGHSPCLCNVNGGLFIGIEKKLFYSHFIRLIGGYYLGHIIIDDFQPSVEIHIRRSGYCTVVNNSEFSAVVFKHSESHNGVARVDTKYSQIHSSVQFQRYPIMTLL